MTPRLSARPRLRAGLLVAAGASVGLVLLAFVVVGVDRLIGDDAEAEPGPHAGSAPSDGDPVFPPASSGPPVRPLPEVDDSASDDPAVARLVLPDTDDPDVYAAAVAGVLFGMDYTGHDPADYASLFEEALWDGITGDDRDRVLATISRRIPTPEMWEQMRSVGQAAQFDIDLVWEPRAARDHREAGDSPEGVLARTVSGTQAETWRPPGQDTRTASRRVAVTVVLACPPASSPCRLIGIAPNVES